MHILRFVSINKKKLERGGREGGTETLNNLS